LPKCTKFNFSWGSAPDPLGAYSAPPGLVAGFKGPTSKGKEGRGRVGEGRAGIRRRKGRENTDQPPTIFGSKVALPILRQNRPCMGPPTALPTVTQS